MNTEYVIVIEVDNKRAHAAYLKGLADLDLIWPQIMLNAQKNDEEEERRWKKAKEADDIANEKADKEMREYQVAMEHYKKWEPAFFLGSQRPPLPLIPISHYLRRSSHCYRAYHVRSYESTRKELQNMANLAGAALGPYKMTEHKVREMIEWEDGSRIERIKQYM